MRLNIFPLVFFTQVLVYSPSSGVIHPGKHFKLHFYRGSFDDPQRQWNVDNNIEQGIVGRDDPEAPFENAIKLGLYAYGTSNDKEEIKIEAFLKYDLKNERMIPMALTSRHEFLNVVAVETEENTNKTMVKVFERKSHYYATARNFMLVRKNTAPCDFVNHGSLPVEYKSLPESRSYELYFYQKVDGSGWTVPAKANNYKFSTNGLNKIDLRATGNSILATYVPNEKEGTVCEEILIEVKNYYKLEFHTTPQYPHKDNLQEYVIVAYEMNFRVVRGHQVYLVSHVQDGKNINLFQFEALVEKC